jgi:putative addiction module CopG family antidote
MLVDLDPQLESTIREKAQSGQYIDANDVVREALELLEERDRHMQLRAAVKLGIDDVAAGSVRAWTPDRLAELKRTAEAEDSQGAPISADAQP